MLNVEQFRYGADNLAYVIFGSRYAMAIDGGAWEDILGFLKRQDLVLKFVTNTHSHFDHTPGNTSLLKYSQAAFLDFEDLTDNKEISLDGGKITIFRTPGHSHDSLCFYTGSALITGDTLFNGTIGNCFTGDLKGFYMSIKRLMTLPPETLVYSGHDYVRDSLMFAAYLEPGNTEIDRYRLSYDSDHVYSTLEEELKINPFLRFNEEPIIGLLKNKGLPHTTEWERWQSLMSIE
ncbi:MAG: MBL fold metallo-hydrolase [Syntrophales bacterium]|nr:MBL fold metallo-hydrolase [Syntrophales bacterium]